MPADGSGAAECLTTIEAYQPASWSPDRQVLAFVLVQQNGSNPDIWMLPLEGEPQPFIQSPFDEEYPTFSPDGRWLAYTSNQSGRREVYVTPYPGPGPKHPISTDGGYSPAWAPNGRELFYRTPRNSEGFRSMMAVEIATEPTFTAGRPRLLFKEDRYAYASPVRAYDVTPDGRRFLMLERVSQPRESVTEIHIVLNWYQELKRLVPTEK